MAETGHISVIGNILYNSHNMWILFPGLIIICREVMVSGLREFLAEIHITVSVSKLSKYKTMVQMVAITGLLLGEKGSNYTVQNILGNYLAMDIKMLIVAIIINLAKFLFCLASVLTIITGYRYWQIGFSKM